jgi:hypothetical protein
MEPLRDPRRSFKCATAAIPDAVEKLAVIDRIHTKCGDLFVCMSGQRFCQLQQMTCLQVFTLLGYCLILYLGFCPIVDTKKVGQYPYLWGREHMDFAAEILRRLEQLDLNVNQAEARAGFPQGFIRGVVRADQKRAIPNVEKAQQIAHALGLEFYIGPPREAPPAAPTMVDGSLFDTVARFDAAGSAGNGALNLDGPPIDHLAFSKRWLAQNGISAGDSLLINVRGDSMEPSLYDGDLVMIDRRKTHIRSGQIYAFCDGDTLRIKRIEIIPGTALILRSDNPKYPPEHRTGEAMNGISQNILGQIVWSGHTWG